MLDIWGVYPIVGCYPSQLPYHLHPFYFLMSKFKDMIAKQTLKVLLTRYFWKWEGEKGRGGVEGKSGGGGSKEVGEVKVGKYSYIKSQNTAGIGF